MRPSPFWAKHCDFQNAGGYKISCILFLSDTRFMNIMHKRIMSLPRFDDTFHEKFDSDRKTGNPAGFDRVNREEPLWKKLWKV